ncbi:unnamed protein product [Periconia digitata]|uniref:Methyltransferase domain-containing protein n=1 Tax=Periconia digitata TaxID=1303443 RepID=A0A9W4UPJ1_9PLEO|nr:unnamed protein product [Periconia digitata]
MADEQFLEKVFTATSTDESRKLYDQWASSYDSDMAIHEFTAPQMVAERVSKYLENSKPSKTQIVDAGCGSGAVGVELSKLGYLAIDGLDISQGMLDVARKLDVYRELNIADLTKRLDVEDGAYDALVCCGTFTHGHLGHGPLEDFVRVVQSRRTICRHVLSIITY